MSAAGTVLERFHSRDQNLHLRGIKININSRCPSEIPAAQKNPMVSARESRKRIIKTPRAEHYSTRGILGLGYPRSTGVK